MSICTFIAADVSLPEFAPSKEYPLEINVDKGTIYDGDADDNYNLISFPDVGVYTNKKHAVYLEWNYTEGRAEQIIQYIKSALDRTSLVELWHVWLMDYYEYEESPVIHKKTVAFSELTTKHIKETSNGESWNTPDLMYPKRPSFYCLIITRE